MTARKHSQLMSPRHSRSQMQGGSARLHAMCRHVSLQRSMAAKLQHWHRQQEATQHNVGSLNTAAYS